MVAPRTHEIVETLQGFILYSIPLTPRGGDVLRALKRMERRITEADVQLKYTPGSKFLLRTRGRYSARWRIRCAAPPASLPGTSERIRLVQRHVLVSGCAHDNEKNDDDENDSSEYEGEF
jgi:hypothetical protein